MENEVLKKIIPSVIPNKLIRFKHQFSFRQQYGWTEYIGLVRGIDFDHGYIYIGHPYDVDTKTVTMGELGVEFSDEFVGIKDIENVTREEYELWKQLYKEFHRSILREKNYDVCKENLRIITI